MCIRDRHVVRWLSDRILVMYLGEVVEIGPAEQLFTASAHPYTRALLSSMPSMDPEHRTLTSPLSGDPPSPIAVSYTHLSAALPVGNGDTPGCNDYRAVPSPFGRGVG